MRRHAEQQPPLATNRAPPLKRVVKAGLQREGEPLPAATRDTMEARFGRDFGDVRLHTDEAAGASALALGAGAYTVGRDIVLSPGALDRADADKLLAHELAHAATNAATGATAEPERISAPGSREERQAERAADAAMSGRPVGALAAGPGGGGAVVHRSLLGAGIGGLIGGVGLGLLGSLLGPVGAVVGAVVGTVAGAIIGDRLSRRERGLSSDEKIYAKEIYRDSVDYDAIRITRDSAAAVGAARTLGNTINLQARHFKGDTMELSDEGQLVLIHEMGHVWQYQNGGLDYIPSSLIPQIEAAFQGKSRNAAYDWRQAIADGISWSDWNAEQQAELISDYNTALRKIRANTALPKDYQTVALAQPYIELVRQRFGAPGMREGRVVTGSTGGGKP